VIAVTVALVLDVAEITIGVWYSKRRKAKVGAESMVGATGVALAELRPDGQVRVNGEIWRASCIVGCDQGADIVVRGVDGLTLEVEPA
jgi:membrane-bound serine protease (ClpP class)